MTKLLSFHNDPAIKEKYLNRVREHRRADQIVKGQYWEKGKGCAVGCTIHSDQHDAYETKLGLPKWLAYLEDGIFEGLPNDQALDFPEQFLTAIPVGADVSKVYNQFMYWLLMDKEHGVLRIAEKYKDEKAIAAIKRVGDLHQKEIDGVGEDDAAWNAAWAAAWAAGAAWNAAWAAAWAAGAAAGAAARAAAGAAAGAAARAAGDAARDAARISQRDKILELLSKCDNHK